MAKRNGVNLAKTGLKPICFVAGKSGGHIIPCLTIAQNEYPNRPLLFFSTQAPLDYQLLNNGPVSHSCAPSPTWHIPLPFGRTSTISLSLLIALSASILKTIWWLIKHRPSKIISTGGLVSVPVCIVGYLLSIDIELFELNATPGRATTLLAPLATTIYSCFETTQNKFPAQKIALRSYPLRFTNKKQRPHHVINQLGLSRNKKTILVLGGSQGSAFINRVICSWIDSLPQPTSIQIIHQVGLAEQNKMELFYAQRTINAKIFSFILDMAPLYRAADLVICRAGAGTLFEIMHFNKSCITIPLQTKETDHQMENALTLSKRYERMIVLKQDECSAEKLGTAIKDLETRTI